MLLKLNTCSSWLTLLFSIVLDNSTDIEEAVRFLIIDVKWKGLKQCLNEKGNLLEMSDMLFFNSCGEIPNTQLRWVLILMSQFDMLKWMWFPFRTTEFIMSITQAKLFF